MGEANFLQVVMAPEYWEALGEIGTLATMRTPLLALANDL